MSRSKNHSCTCWLCSPDERRAKFRDAKRTVENPTDLVEDGIIEFCGDLGIFCETCSESIDEYNAQITTESRLVYTA